VSQQLRRLDGKVVLKKVPDKLKHFLSKILTPFSLLPHMLC